MLKKGWLLRTGTLISLILLALGSITPALAGLQRTAGVRGLLRARLGEPDSRAGLVIPCARTSIDYPTNLDIVKTALDLLENLALDPEQSAHLLGTAYCLLGDIKSAEQIYDREEDSFYAGVQWIALNNIAGQTEASVQQLDKSNLSEREAVEILTGLINDQPELDWRPHLRLAVSQYPQTEALWQLWWKIGLKLERDGDWQSAAGWFQEGSRIQKGRGVSVYISSFDLQVGRYFQVYHNPPDPETALTYYNQALEVDHFYTSGDYAYAYFLRGEVYQTLKDRYTAQQALEEYQRALALSPDNYWFHLGIGRFFALELKDFVQAEQSYQHAQQLNPELPNSYDDLGDLYRMLGDSAQAESFYRQALARQPDYQPALDGLKTLGVSP